MTGSPRTPIAVIGAACRFPGGIDTPEAFWSALSDGRDLAGAHGGRAPTGAGGRLEDPFSFDAAAFQISPREAAQMDPHQRVFLQVACEAFLDAGLTRARLMGTRTGVVAGVYASDYLLMRARRPETVMAHTAGGVSHAVVANRVSYVYDLSGPSFAVDSACSSSLLAVHLAVRMLRQGDADTCLAGGVSLILDDAPHQITAGALAMAPDGFCKAFDASADGIVRSEGCGAVVLKRLADALADGDPIRGVILGSATNQDGRTNGLSAPSAQAQQAVIRAALADADTQAAEVAFVEAHGTGTPLGDPVEINALAAVYGDRDDAPWIGAAKANLGHAEAASGMAGLLKTLGVVQHRRAPPQPHLTVLNPAVEQVRRGLRISADGGPLAATPRACRAAVSAFGFSGTNVHLVLRGVESSEVRAVGAPPAAVFALPVSAQTPDALVDQLRAYGERIAGVSAEDATQVCRAAAVRREPLDCRAVVTARDPHALSERLLQARPGAQDSARTTPPLTAFLFTGQTAQWPGMGRTLAAADPVFAARLAEIDAAFERQGDAEGPLASLWTLPVNGPAGTAVAQKANFVLQIALAETLERCGVEPAAVAGHSVGEAAAACIAGLLTLEDGVRLVRARAALMEQVEGGGRMIAVRGDLEAFRGRLKAVPGAEIAAENSPHALAIACPASAVAEVQTLAAATGCLASLLPTTVAFHSRAMEPLQAALETALVDLQPKPPRLDMVSSVDPHAAVEADAAYWSRALRQPVRFREAVDQLLAMDIEVFVEIGPHPVLTVLAQETALAAGRDALVQAPLRRHADEPETFAAALGELWVRGVPVDWAEALGRPTGRVRLPSPPFGAGQRHWDLTHLPPQAAPAPPAAAVCVAAPAAPPDDGPLDDQVAAHVAEVMRASQAVDRDVALQALGFDSLMALELKKRLEAAYGVTLSPTLLLGSPSSREISAALAAALGERQVAHLSDHQVEHLLRQLQDAR